MIGAIMPQLRPHDFLLEVMLLSPVGLKQFSTLWASDENWIVDVRLR